MFDKRQKRVPYSLLKTILRLPLLRTRYVRVHGHPSTRENRDNAAPNNVPDAATIPKVGARIRLE